MNQEGGELARLQVPTVGIFAVSSRNLNLSQAAWGKAEDEMHKYLKELIS